MTSNHDMWYFWTNSNYTNFDLRLRLWVLDQPMGRSERITFQTFFFFQPKTVIPGKTIKSQKCPKSPFKRPIADYSNCIHCGRHCSYFKRLKSKSFNYSLPQSNLSFTRFIYILTQLINSQNRVVKIDTYLYRYPTVIFCIRNGFAYLSVTARISKKYFTLLLTELFWSSMNYMSNTFFIFCPFFQWASQRVT